MHYNLSQLVATLDNSYKTIHLITSFMYNININTRFHCEENIFNAVLYNHDYGLPNKVHIYISTLTFNKFTKHNVRHRKLRLFKL